MRIIEVQTTEETKAEILKEMQNLDLGWHRYGVGFKVLGSDSVIENFIAWLNSKLIAWIEED